VREHPRRVHILVMSNCTDRKTVVHDRMLTMEDFRDLRRLRAREAELTAYRVPACRLYASRRRRGRCGWSKGVSVSHEQRVWT